MLVLGYICECCCRSTSQFLPIYERDEKLGSLNASLDCTFKFLPIH